MKAKKVQNSDFDFKKWGVFLLFLVVVAAGLVYLLKPEGESQARLVIDEARLMNRKAREAALKSGTPQDMANLDFSSEALSKATDLFRESEFNAAVEEAQKAVRFAKKITTPDEDPGFGASVRFGELVGEVQIRKKGESAFNPAVMRQTLGLGDALRTTAGGCQLIHKNGTQTRLLPNSYLELEENLDLQATDNDLSFYLESGSLEVKTGSREAGRVHLRTPAGKALVFYDTDMEAHLGSSNALELRVRQGRVDALGNGKTEVLSSNQQVVMEDGAPSGGGRDVLPPPVLVKPVAASKYPTNQNGFSPVTLVWQEVPGAGHYHLEIASDPVFLHMVEEKARYSGTRLNYPNMRIGTYYWRVTAMDRQGNRGITTTPYLFEVIAADATTAVSDGEPPILEVKEAVVQGSVAIINGRTSRDASVKLNGEVALVDKETGIFRHVLKLPGYGRHNVSIVAESNTGTIAFKNITLEIKD